MKTFNRSRVFVAFVMMFCLLLAPLTAYAKKGEKNYNQGLKYEQDQKWDLAAQEFALAIALNPSDTEYRLHYQRAMFNASQMFMQRGSALEEKQDYAGAYNAFRQAYSYDRVNELALSEMARMMRLQQDKTSGATKENKTKENVTQPGVNLVPTSYPTSPTKENHKRSALPSYGNPVTEQKRTIAYSSTDLKSIIKQLATQLDLNVIFDNTTFRQTRTAELSLKDVTTAQALDLLFLQEGLFFQRINRRTIIVADQTRRPVYQQLVIRTFYLANAKPEDVRTMLNNIIPAQAGRMQTIIVPDKETNSVTIRDTTENVRLIGELIQNIDKDRPEVVIDVNIYEVSKDALLQLGNQVGTEKSLNSLGGIAGGGLFENTRIPFNAALSAAGGLATGLGLLIPTSTLSAFQRKNNGRLLVSTQVHAFSNEESQTRVGERVPVQTAQVFTNTNTGSGNNGANNGGAFGNTGFPVINFEPIGLTLKFTPIVFPNKDVQVKMSIESKDVRNANTLTPTFVERSITGTARIQNNRTMLLASINQDRASNGRSGLPLLGLIPVLGRMFSTPSQDNAKTDIVIAVTPHVLRAPDITPRDLDVYESGTLQNPTPNSIADMIRKEDEEEQLAQVDRQPTNIPVVQETSTNPTTEETAPPYVPATQEELNNGTETTIVSDEAESKIINKDTPVVMPQPINANKAVKNVAINPTAEKVRVNNNREAIKTETGPSKAIGNHLNSEANAAAVNMGFTLEKADPKSNKRRVALMIDVQNPLGMASMKLRFDTKMITIRNITNGNFFATDKAPGLTQYNTPDGLILTINPPAGSFIKGKGTLVYLEVELLQKGESALNFDARNSHFIAVDGRTVSVQFLQNIMVN